MRVRRRRASLGSVTRICCRMISSDVIGRRTRPGDAGPDVWLSVRAIIGCAPDDSRLGLSPSAFLTRLPMTLPPVPLLALAPAATGDDTSPSAARAPDGYRRARRAAGHEDDLVRVAASESGTAAATRHATPGPPGTPPTTAPPSQGPTASRDRTRATPAACSRRPAGSRGTTSSSSSATRPRRPRPPAAEAPTAS